MDKKPQTIKNSTKDELVMYLLLFVGIISIVTLFAVNVMLIDRIMENTILENQILRDSYNSSSNETTETYESEIPLNFTLEDTGTELPEVTLDENDPNFPTDTSDEEVTLESE